MADVFQGGIPGLKEFSPAQVSTYVASFIATRSFVSDSSAVGLGFSALGLVGLLFCP